MVDAFFDDVKDGPELHPLGDIFAGSAKTGGRKPSPIDSLPSWARGIPPDVKRCETQAELADWFQEFAMGCRFARVNPCS